MMVWALWCFGKVKEACSSTLGEKKRQLPGEAEKENRSPQEGKIISLGDKGQQNELEDSRVCTSHRFQESLLSSSSRTAPNAKNHD